MAVLLERSANPADAAVHHVGRRHHVRAGFCVGHGLAHEHGDRLVVEHVAIVIDDAVLAMRGVGIQRDVGDDDKVGVFGLDGPDRGLHQPVRIGALRAVEALVFRADDRKQRHGGNAEVNGLAELAQQPVDTLALDARHRGDRLDGLGAFEHEDRVDQVPAAERGFCHEAAQSRGATAAPQADCRELTGARTTHNSRYKHNNFLFSLYLGRVSTLRALFCVETVIILRSAGSSRMHSSNAAAQRRQRFDQYVAVYHQDMYRYAAWLSRDQAIAQDVVQEALLRAWKSLDNLRDEGSAKQWLLTIVRRENARFFERKRLETVDIDNLTASQEALLGVEENNELDDMRKAIYELDDEYREPLVLQVLMGYSTNEIAEQMGLKQGAVLTRLHRARARLKDRVAEQ